MVFACPAQLAEPALQGVGGLSNDTGRGPGKMKAPPCLGPWCVTKSSCLRLHALRCWHPRHCPHRPLRRTFVSHWKAGSGVPPSPRLPRPFQSCFAAKGLTVSISWGLCPYLSLKGQMCVAKMLDYNGSRLVSPNFREASLLGAPSRRGEAGSHMLELCGLWACLLPQAEQGVKSVASLGERTWAPCLPQVDCSRPTAPNQIR